MNQERPVLKGVVYFKVGASLLGLGFTSRRIVGLFRAALRLPSPTVLLIAFLDKNSPLNGFCPCSSSPNKKRTLVFLLRRNPSPLSGDFVEEAKGEAKAQDPCWVLSALASREPYLNN